MLVLESHKRTQVENSKPTFFTVEAKCSAVAQFLIVKVNMSLPDRQTGETMLVFLSLCRRKYNMYKELWKRKLRGLNEDEESTVLPRIQV